MKYLILFLTVLFVPFAAQAEPQTFMSAEYAPYSKHLTDDDAPRGGYNEDNHIVTFKVGREHTLNEEWRVNYAAGYSIFNNSYDQTSHGLGGGLEGLYTLTPNLAAYGGADIGLVSGYDGYVDDDYVILGELIPFVALNAGAEYKFPGKFPAIRGGIKYVPASVVGSDDVVAFTMGARFFLQ